MGTSKMQPRPFLAPVAAQMGEEVAEAIAEALANALKGDSSKDSIIPVGTSPGGRTQSLPFNPLGVLVPGSPENELWARGTIRLFRELGHILRSDQQGPDPSDSGASDSGPSLAEIQTIGCSKDGRKLAIRPRSLQGIERSGIDRPGWSFAPIGTTLVNLGIAGVTTTTSKTRVRRAPVTATLTGMVVRCRGTANLHISCRERSRGDLG